MKIDKKLNSEEYIRMSFSDAISDINFSGPLSKQLDDFLKAIEFEHVSECTKKAFMIAGAMGQKCSLPSYNNTYIYLTYDSLAIKMQKAYPTFISTSTVEHHLKSDFSKWKKAHQEELMLKELYPTLSIMNLLRLFAFLANP